MSYLKVAHSAMGAVCSLHSADVRQRWNIVIHFGFLMTSCDRNISARMKICALSLLGSISAPQLIFSLKRYCSRIFCEQKFSMPARALKTSRMPRKKIYHLLTSIILVYTYPRQHLSLPNQCSCTPTNCPDVRHCPDVMTGYTCTYFIS